ncbi:MAG: hypothetical protein LUO93_09530, partial [Methanomicrobiales archaeon]|nr:hypothetical protein [Methanomicrobiales archaeon]
MAVKGMKSGDVREYRSVERKLLEGIQDPQINSLMKKLDEWGIPRELASVALNVAKNNGLLPKVLGAGNNGFQNQTEGRI